jgi:iron-sulfur cluster assembly protein
MFEVSQAAQQQIAEFFKDKEIKPIRLFLNQSGWGGPSLALVLDEPNDLDDTFAVNGFSFIVNKTLLKQVQPVLIDFKGYGFQISSNLKQKGGCSSCGTSNTCGWFTGR